MAPAPLRPGVREFPADLLPLTSLRFLLALGVVGFHYQIQAGAELGTGLFERARLGVDIFFILSGFILTHVYREQIETGRYHHGKFLWARFARVYPLHLAIMLGLLLMVFAARLMGADFAADTYSWGGFAEALLLVQAWFPGGEGGGWNQPSWSLSAEWFAYLAFPFYAWIGLKLKDRPGLLLALAAVSFVAIDAAYRAAFGQILPHAQFTMGILRIAPEFLYGVALYRLGQKVDLSARSAGLAAAAAFAALLGLMHFSIDDRLIVAAAGPVVLSLALLSKAGADRPVSRPWMVTAGEASYAVYLIHFPVIIVWKGLASVLTGKPSDYLVAPFELVGMLVLTLVAAYAAHFLLERPSREWLRGVGQRLWGRPARLVGTPSTQPPDY